MTANDKTSQSESMKLSVITVTYNAAAVLQRTMESVLDQPADVDYIIVDGGSSDDTISIVESFGDRIRFISEPDNGIYDAMNKGIRMARGQGMLFMNAGDYLQGSVLTDEISIPCFLPVYYTDPLGRFRRIPIKKASRGIPNCHQGIVFERRTPAIFYDPGYRVASDLDFFLRYEYDETLPVANTAGYVLYDNAGFSKQNIRIRDAEIASIVKKHFGTLAALRFRTIAWIKRLAGSLLPSRRAQTS